MINYSLKGTSRDLRKAVSKSVDASYIRQFNNAVLNLELNMQEERIKRTFR